MHRNEAAVKARAELATPATSACRPFSSTLSAASQDTWHGHQLSSPSQSSFSVNSADSHYSWQIPEAQEKKTLRDQHLPFPGAGTATVRITAKSLRICYRSTAYQVSQKGSEQPCIQGLVQQQQQPCTPKKDFPLYESVGWGFLKCVTIIFCQYLKQLWQVL